MLPKKRLQRSPIQPVLSGCCGDLHRPLRCTLGNRMGIVTPDQCPFGGCHDGLHKLTEIQIAQFGKLPVPGYCLQKCLFVHRLPHPAQRIVLSLAFDGKQIRIPGQNAKSIQAQLFQDDSGRNFLLHISPGGSFKQIRDAPSLSILLQTQMHLSAICILNDADCDRDLLAGPDAAPAPQDRAIPFSSGWGTRPEKLRLFSETPFPAFVLY